MQNNILTTGISELSPGTGIQLHKHNVEEVVLVLEGEATVVLGDESCDLVTGDSTWTPAGLPHCFRNRGLGPLRIYWTYAGREVTRTLHASGETYEHLSLAESKAAALVDHQDR